jgi:hypothetical protein
MVCELFRIPLVYLCLHCVCLYPPSHSGGSVQITVILVTGCITDVISDQSFSDYRHALYKEGNNRALLDYETGKST